MKMASVFAMGRALYQGPTLVGPYKTRSEMGFSPGCAQGLNRLQENAGPAFACPTQAKSRLEWGTQLLFGGEWVSFGLGVLNLVVRKQPGAPFKPAFGLSGTRKGWTDVFPQPVKPRLSQLLTVRPKRLRKNSFQRRNKADSGPFKPFFGLSGGHLRSIFLYPTQAKLEWATLKSTFSAASKVVPRYKAHPSAGREESC
jgi:hypothetical protein